MLGYHGCDEAVARDAVLDGVDILESDKDYDWLGPGAYFGSQTLFAQKSGQSGR